MNKVNHYLSEAALSCRCGFCASGNASTVSRRAVLTASAAALLAGSLPRVAAAQTALSPDQAIAALLDGNRRYVARQLNSFSEDLEILRQNTVEKQEPFAAVLSCVDSRVPVEFVFDQAIGHVFVARVAGNFCTPEIIASLEYGAAVLGTAAILVLGHEGCGAVKAAMAAKAVPGQISALYAPLRPAVEQGGGDLASVVQANARIQANLLSTTSPVLADLIAQKRLKIVGGYYSLGNGAVTLLG